MNNNASRAIARSARPRRAIALLAWSAVASIACAATPAGIVPMQFQGTWVPGKGSCESAVRVSIGADRLTLENGKDSQALGGIEMAGPGYFQPDYAGIMAVLITEFSGDQPVTATFNVGEKKGAAQLDFAPVMPGRATAQLAKYNAHISKLNLAKRFPLDKVALKRCAGVAPAR